MLPHVPHGKRNAVPQKVSEVGKNQRVQGERRADVKPAEGYNGTGQPASGALQSGDAIEHTGDSCAEMPGGKQIKPSEKSDTAEDPQYTEQAGFGRGGGFMLSAFRTVHFFLLSKMLQKSFGLSPKAAARTSVSYWCQPDG